MQPKKFFVEAETRAGKVIGYGVYDVVNGLRSQHAIYIAPGDGSVSVCKFLAGRECRDLNRKAK